MIYLIGNEELGTVKVGYSETTEGVILFNCNVDSYLINKKIIGKNYAEAFVRVAAFYPNRTMEQIAMVLDIEGIKRSK